MFTEWSSSIRGYRWSDIPQLLQVYGLGDLKFGHLTYIVLTGILVRDIFPDPDVVCQFLKGNQWHAITWFCEWMLRSRGTGGRREESCDTFSDGLRPKISGRALQALQNSSAMDSSLVQNAWVLAISNLWWLQVCSSG